MQLMWAGVVCKSVPYVEVYLPEPNAFGDSVLRDLNAIAHTGNAACASELPLSIALSCE